MKYITIFSFLLSLFSPLSANYRMHVSDANQFVWFKVEKVGTQTITKILRENVPFCVLRKPPEMLQQRYKKHFKFAFVRNPWDRVVSVYCNKIVPKRYGPFRGCYDKSFEYFVDFIKKRDLTKADMHIRLQTCIIPVDQVNFIGRFERFEEDLKKVLKIIGLQKCEIPRQNPSDHKHYCTYYTEETKAIITEKYKDDIEAFGYTFETKPS